MEQKRLNFYLPDHQVNIVLEMEIELLLQALDPLIQQRNIAIKSKKLPGIELFLKLFTKLIGATDNFKAMGK